ncbi:MAG TPA: hypothetical protein VFL94_14105 [Actinomycetales bacterium]|nr:hypothetical protein [Actinomycetales bacterium]
MVATSTSRLQDDDKPTPHDDVRPDHATPDVAPAEHVMELLEEHVPLSLLMDLVEPAGPDSRDILTTEGAPEEAWWAQP